MTSRFLSTIYLPAIFKPLGLELTRQMEAAFGTTPEEAGPWIGRHEDPNKPDRLRAEFSLFGLVLALLWIKSAIWPRL